MTITLEDVRAAVAANGKAVSARQLLRYFTALGIKPEGARQRPQIYPPDATDRVLEYLGLTGAVETTAGVISVGEAKRRAKQRRKS